MFSIHLFVAYTGSGVNHVAFKTRVFMLARRFAKPAARSVLQRICTGSGRHLGSTDHVTDACSLHRNMFLCPI